MLVTENYVFFQGSNDFLSNFHPAPFVYKNLEFPTVEHFFQYCKAHHFGDSVRMTEILKAKSPMEAKILGGKVTPYDDQSWLERAQGVMMAGLRLKFDQNPHLKTMLMNPDFESKEFVECSRRDKRWAIGIPINSDLIHNEEYWVGLNWLGECYNDLYDAYTIEESVLLAYPHSVENYPVQHDGKTRMCRAILTEGYKTAIENTWAMIVRKPVVLDSIDAYEEALGRAGETAVAVLYEDFQKGIELDPPNYLTSNNTEVDYAPRYSWSIN